MEHNEIQDRLQNLQQRYPNENVERIYHSAVGFYGSVEKRWPPQQFGRVLSAEGGRLGLIFNYTLNGLAAAPAHLKGFIEYNNYVRRLYYLGEKYKWGHMSSLDDALFSDGADSLYDRLPDRDTNIPDPREETPFCEGDSPSGVLLQLLPPHSSQGRVKGTMKALTAIELEFLDTLAYVGSPKEAAELVGKTAKWGFQVVRKLRRVTTRVGVTST